MFVFILGARSRKPFQSQLFELSLRQRIGSMVSRTRLNLRRLYFSLCLFLHLFSSFLYKLHTILRIIDVFHWVYKPFIFKIFFSNFQIICSRRKTIYTFYLFGGKTERNKVSKPKHWKFKIAMKGIYFFWSHLSRLALCAEEFCLLHFARHLQICTQFMSLHSWPIV